MEAPEKEHSMQVRTFSQHAATSEYVASQIISVVSAKPDALLCLATGDTPLMTYKILVDEVSRRGVDFSSVKFVALDEWLGIPGTVPGSCRYFLETNLFKFLPLQEKNIKLFDGLSKNPDEECREVDKFIQDHMRIDLMVVGIGMNGHVGFNEPGVREDLFSHVIELDETTRTVGQKYFEVATLLTHGITLGFNHIMDARKVILIANGKHKAPVIAKALHGPVSTELPASLLRNHPDCVFALDADAAALLDR
jgi:glucosamine-6-phosphate isomerase